MLYKIAWSFALLIHLLGTFIDEHYRESAVQSVLSVLIVAVVICQIVGC